ncbi:MAG: carbamoyltransferase [Spirochaetes bacterium]|nr:carbamoyltransferase [Spirochaetota bacterium]
MPSKILGISAYYHDSAAALLVDSKIIAAAQEERFTRKKHDPAFPINAVKYVLEEGGVELKDLDVIAFYDKPYIKFERLLETYHAFAPKGLVSFLSAIPVWIKEKLFMKKMLRDELKKIGDANVKIIFPEHHLSHAASAFFPSPFKEAAILTLDGVGEWATTTISIGKDNNIKMLKELNFPHSLGLLYSAFTYYCGFKVNSGEYKLMGLAPYGNPDSKIIEELKEKIFNNLVDVREDGSILLNMKYFSYATGLKMCNLKKWEKLFGFPKRNPESELTEPYMNLALAIQQVTEDIILKLAQTAKEITGSNNLVLAGGVALNCVANGKLLQTKIFDDIWIQPAAGDAGGALGAAYTAWHIWKGQERTIEENQDSMQGAYLGPEFSDLDIEKIIRKYQAPNKYYKNFNELSNTVAKLINDGNVIGWFQGRMEFGPRALGNRSIIGDVRHPEMQKKLNLKIKYRESFRPFAPSVLEEDIQEYFELEKPSPYMLLVAPVHSKRRNIVPEEYNNLPLRERLYFLRSDIPAITHIDFSARVQSVNKNVNERYWQLINHFKKITGYGIIVNTSFNVRGEPIVCTPLDAYLCFMRTEMDYLVINNHLFNKTEQQKFEEEKDWRDTYTLD